MRTKQIQPIVGIELKAEASPCSLTEEEEHIQIKYKHYLFRALFLSLSLRLCVVCIWYADVIHYASRCVPEVEN